MDGTKMIRKLLATICVNQNSFCSILTCLSGVCQLFEQRLKNLHPNRQKITYDISDLFEFLESLKDLCCLVYAWISLIFSIIFFIPLFDTRIGYLQIHDQIRFENQRLRPAQQRMDQAARMFFFCSKIRALSSCECYDLISII
jgi:hypothetical protein